MTACIKSDFVHKLKSISKGKVTRIEKTEYIIFDATGFIQMLSVLSKTDKVASVAIVEQYRGYTL